MVSLMASLMASLMLSSVLIRGPRLSHLAVRQETRVVDGLLGSDGGAL